MFLNSINNFRAISIILIVIGHCRNIVPSVSPYSIGEEIFINLFISGGTNLFVFISGFLFHHVSCKKFAYKTFIILKFKNILLPYLILGTMPVAYCVISQRNGWGEYFLPNGGSIFYRYIIPVVKYYLTGRFLTGYWYIPFISLIFLISPFFIKFIEMQLKSKVMVIVVLTTISAFLHRPINNINVLQSVVYFLPVFLMGMLCSQNKDQIYSYIFGKEIFFLLSAVGLAVIQALLGINGNYSKDPLAYGGIDIILIQKIFLCLFLMVWLHRYESLSNKYVQLIASTSFAIYFLHPFLLIAFAKVCAFLGINFSPSLLIYPFFITFIIGLCVIMALLLKKILPKYSRYIIGY